jgi:hypothetical protein
VLYALAVVRDDGLLYDLEHRRDEGLVLLLLG